MEKECKFNIKPSPTLPMVVTVGRSRLYGGWKIYRGGQDVITSRIFASEEDAVANAKAYCAKWGDEYGGIVPEEGD